MFDANHKKVKVNICGHTQYSTHFVVIYNFDLKNLWLANLQYIA